MVTSLVVQWSRLCLQCRGWRFDPWSGSWDPTCLSAKKPKHKTETQWVSGALWPGCDLMTLVALGLGRVWSCPSSRRESQHLGPPQRGGTIFLLMHRPSCWPCVSSYLGLRLLPPADLSILQFLTVVCYGVGQTCSLREGLGLSDFGFLIITCLWMISVQWAHSMSPPSLDLLLGTLCMAVHGKVFFAFGRNCCCKYVLSAL